MLCRFRHALGREGEGAHSLRLFDVAIVDVALTLLAAAAISVGVGHSAARFAAISAALFAVGVAAHRAFCVNTTINKAIFGKLA